MGAHKKLLAAMLYNMEALAQEIQMGSTEVAYVEKASTLLDYIRKIEVLIMEGRVPNAGDLTDPRQTHLSLDRHTDHVLQLHDIERD